MAGVARSITGFSEDADGVWVAQLECGHGQHVRHQPPWQLRPWVLSEQGRARHLGIQLDCVKCSMPTLPAGAERYKVLGPFTQATIPAGFLRQHSLKARTWGRLVIAEGELSYVIERDPDVSFVLSPGVPGIVQPEEVHHIEARGSVKFEVEFWSKS